MQAEIVLVTIDALYCKVLTPQYVTVIANQCT